jgi:two-component sensor histidine kinase
MPSRQPSSVRRAPAWRTAVPIVGIWLGVGLFTTQSTYLVLRRAGAEAHWMSIFSANLLSVLLWAAFTPAMIWVARRAPLARGEIVRPAIIHTLACFGFAVADVVLEHVLLQGLPWIHGTPGDIISIFLRRLFLNSLCYVAVVAIATVIDHARISREREARTVRLAAQLTEARLQALHAQLRPHFLFNTLSMIAEQVYADPAGADRMIGRLSHLLRMSLSSTEHQEVTLAEEQESLQAYLDIMDVRLSGRVRVRVDVPSELNDALVPTLILQPLAENAFRHGIEPVRRDAELLAQARQVDGWLKLVIADNGKGFDPKKYREGVGLRVVRERLQQLYGDDASFQLKPQAGGGTLAVVRLPLRVASVPSAAHHTSLVSIP